MQNLRAYLRRKQAKFRRGRNLRRGLRNIKNCGFWFVDVPRTSSSSIRAELARRFGPVHGKADIIEPGYATEEVYDVHTPAREMRAMVGPGTWDGLFVFTVVRNPWDRALSIFHYRRLRGQIPDDWSFRDYVDRLVEADETTPGFEYRGYRMDAADYILSEDGIVLVDEVVRFENRAEGLQRVGARIGLPDLGSLHLQRATPQATDYRHAYDDATREKVATYHARDILLFGYDF